MSLLERVVLKSLFIQDVLGERRKVCNKLNRCISKLVNESNGEDLPPPYTKGKAVMNLMSSYKMYKKPGKCFLL